MPVNGMNVGNDYQIGLYDATTGQIVTLGDVQNFTAKKNVHPVNSMPYNGDPKFGHVPNGYDGTFTLTRTGSQLEDLQLALDAAFKAGQAIKPGFISETIANPDGTVSRYQYTGVDFYMEEVATVSREKTSTQSVKWAASNKVQIA